MVSIPDQFILKGSVSAVPERVVLHRLFERNAHHPVHAHRTALIFQDEHSDKCVRLTYLQLEESANRVARAILRVVRKKGGRCNADGDNVVAVSVPPSDTLIVTLLAVWKAGAAYLPLDTHAPTARLHHILSEARPMLVISHQSDCDKNEAYEDFNVVSTEYLEKEAKKHSSIILQENEMFKTANEAPMAVILYTSGSTGAPKGVRAPSRALYNRLRWQWNTFPYSNSEEVCAFKSASTFFDSVIEIWMPLLGEDPKSILVIPENIVKDPERLIAALEEHQIERLVLVPSLLRSILMYHELGKSNARDTRLHRLKLWVCGSEPLASSLIRRFFNSFKNTNHVLCNFYGSTEVTGDVTFQKFTDFKGDVVPIGLPVDNNIIYVMDEKLSPVPNGQIGQLYCAGLNLASGYVNNRDSDRFIVNPHTAHPAYSVLYKTGDYGRIVDGLLIYEGRMDSQVKVRGHRVVLSEIENSLHKINAVDKVIVLCYKPGGIDQSIVAFVTLTNLNWSAASLENELSKMLPPYSMPEIRVVEEIPLLNNGKTDRHLLLKKYTEEATSRGGYRFPIDLAGVPKSKRVASQCLFNTVASVLGSSLKATIHKNVGFYELGGNSLNSIYTITKLRDQGFVVGITEFIRSKTLGEIVEKMRFEDDDSSASNNEKDNFGEWYEAEILVDCHRDVVSEIIADSFFKKGDLEQWVNPCIKRSDQMELMNIQLAHFVRAGLSFAVRSKKSGRVVGVTLGCDVRDEPVGEITGRLTIILEFLESLEGPIRDNQLSQEKGRILHSHLMGTHEELDSEENVEVITFMKEEVLSLAKRRGFEGVFTIDVNPLTQQLDTYVFSYQVLLDYQVNKYVAVDGSRPFALAPDNQRVLCALKRL